MTISKIRDKITDSGDFNGCATIIQRNDIIECTFLLVVNGKRIRKTVKYKSLEFDIPVNLESCTILKWDEGCRYINYYDKRIK